MSVEGLPGTGGELRTRSEDFRARWGAHNVRHHGTGSKTFPHPAVGDLTLAYEGLEMAAEPGLTLTIYATEPGSPSEDALYLPTVVAAAGREAGRTYGTYWARIATAWADRRLDEVDASDIEAMKHTSAVTARSRRKDSPAHRVTKPRRLPTTRRALTVWELAQVNTTARASGNDAVLDALPLRLHTETACRRGGALSVRLEDLDPDRCLVGLREKGSTVRCQPITPALANCLVDHATARGAILSTVSFPRLPDTLALPRLSLFRTVAHRESIRA